MSKFHINKHGVPAPCRATNGNCPLGGDSGNENHFDTHEDAQAYADKKNAEEHGHLPGSDDIQEAPNLESEVGSAKVQSLPVIEDVNKSQFGSIEDYNKVKDKVVLSDIKTSEHFNGYDLELDSLYLIQDIHGGEKRWVDKNEISELRRGGQIASNDEAKKAYQYLSGVEEHEDKGPDRMRVKSLVLDSETVETEYMTENHYKIIDLEGKERWVDSQNYDNLNDAGLLSHNEEDIYKERPHDYKPTRTNKLRMIDKNTEWYNNGADVDSVTTYKVMDSNGDARWVNRMSYDDLSRNGLIAADDDVFSFPTEANEIEKARPTVMERIRGIFGR